MPQERVCSLGVGMGARDKEKESRARQGEGAGGGGREGEGKKNNVWESQEHLYFAFLTLRLSD